MDPNTTVFIVDDDPSARSSVEALVELMQIRAESYSSAEEFLQHANTDLPSCLVTDVRMLGMSGVELLEKLRADNRNIPVIVITAYADIPLTVRAMQAGAVTLLEKPPREDELWNAIRTSLAIDAEHRQKAAAYAEVRNRLASLTPEETEVLELLLAGTPNKVMMNRLNVSLRTVELRRHNVFKKMQMKSVAELVKAVIQVREQK